MAKLSLLVPGRGVKSRSCCGSWIIRGCLWGVVGLIQLLHKVQYDI